jgi:hypothetical protein
MVVMQEYSRIVIPALVSMLVALVLYGILGALMTKETQHVNRGIEFQEL